MGSVVKATTRSDHTSGGMGQTVTTQVMETVASINRYFAMRLYRVTEKVTRATAVTIEEVTTTADGVMAVGPGKFYLQSTLLKNAAATQVAAFLLSGPGCSLI